MSGQTPEELQFEDPDPSINYLLNHFWKMKRSSFGPISFTELKNYAEMMACDFEANEVEVIMSIDRIFESKANG